MKHGVVIIKHKDWNTKQIWNEGNLMATYGHQPKTLRFKSRFVNDANQDLCGGWSPLDFREEDESVNDPMRRQILRDRKPLGFLFADSKKEAERMAREIQAERPDLDVKMLSPGPHRLNHEVAIAQRGTLEEVFDLGTLYQDYLDSEVVQERQLEREFSKYGGRTLISFADKFDIDEGIPPWVTGLVLGYPVENTISLYRDRIY